LDQKNLKNKDIIVTGLYKTNKKQDWANKPSVNKINCDFNGITDDYCNRLTYLSTGREKTFTPKGTPIANLRQITILSEEELKQIQSDMNISILDPMWLSPNIIIKGYDNFSALQPGTILKFSSGCILYISMQNPPCTAISDVLKEVLPETDRPNAKLFCKAALYSRGLVAIVYAEGEITVNDTVEVLIPKLNP
jgi:hypothetical protein